MSSSKTIIPYKKFTGAVVPNFLMRSKDISQGAKLCYGRLAQFAGQDGRAFPKQDKLAKELAVTPRMVRKYISDLIEAKLLKVTQNGKTKPNSYEFLWHPWMNDDPKIEKSVRNNGSTQERTLLPGTEDYGSAHDRNHSSDPYKENHIKENQRRENTKEREFSSDDVENIFKTYPRKVAYAAGIKEITLALQKLKNRKDIDDPISFLKTKVEEFAKSDIGQVGKFTPYAATWFSEERYLDDPVVWKDKEYEETQTHEVSKDLNVETLESFQLMDEQGKTHELFNS